MSYLLEQFSKDIKARYMQKLAFMSKQAEEDKLDIPFGEEPEFQPSWFERLSNSAPISGLIDFTYGTGLGDLLEKAHETDYQELANSLYDKSGLKTLVNGTGLALNAAKDYTGKIIGESLDSIIPDFSNRRVIRNQQEIERFYNTPRFHKFRKLNKGLINDNITLGD